MNWRSLGKWLLRQQKKDVEPVGPIEVKLYKHDIHISSTTTSVYLNIYNNTNIPITVDSLFDSLNIPDYGSTSCTGYVQAVNPTNAYAISRGTSTNSYLIVRTITGSSTIPKDNLTLTDTVSEITLSN